MIPAASAAAGVVLGFVGVGGQVALSRALLGVMGGAEFVLVVVFAWWLLLTGVGSLVYPSLRRRIDSDDLATGLWVLLAALFPISQALSFPLTATLAGGAGRTAGPQSLIVASLLVLAGPCLAQGVLFSAVAHQLRSAGKVYLFESLGAVAAGALATLGLTLTGDAGLLLTVTAACGLAAMARAQGMGRRIALLAATVVISTGAWLSGGLGPSWYWARYEVRPGLPCRSGTVLSVTDPVSSDVSLFHNGRLYAEDRGVSLESQQRELASILALTPPGEEVLVQGGSLGSLLKATEGMTAERIPRLTLLMSDASLLQAERAAHPWIDRHPQRASVQVLLEDARHLLRRVAALPRARRPYFGAVWLRGGDPLTLAENRFYTSDFIRRLTEVLPGTMVALAAGEATAYLSTSQETYLARLAASALHGATDYGVSILPLDRYLFLLRPQPPRQRPLAPMSASELWSAVQETGLAPHSLSAVYLAERLESSRIDALSQAILSFRGTLNRDDQPISAGEASLLWAQSVADSGAPWRQGFIRWAGYLPPWAVAGALLLPLALLAAFIVLRERRDAGPLVSVLCMGLATMAGEMLVLFQFQTRHGELYHELGILLAAFMAGGAAGAGLAPRFPTRWSLPVACAVLCALTATPLVPLPWRRSWLTDLWPSVVLLAALGAASGVLFHAAAEQLRARRSFARSVSWVNALDHAGAAIGAVAIGIWLIPLLGSYGSWLTLTAAMVIGLSVTLVGVSGGSGNNGTR